MRSSIGQAARAVICTVIRQYNSPAYRGHTVTLYTGTKGQLPARRQPEP